MFVAYPFELIFPRRGKNMVTLRSSQFSYCSLKMAAFQHFPFPVQGQRMQVTTNSCFVCNFQLSSCSQSFFFLF